MTAAILNFARRSARPRDWTDQEIAEFFRVQDALTQAGMQVGTDRGVTDEGEPWFVFYRPATEEVIAHFARIDGEFIADASAVAEPVRGRDLRHVLNQIVNRYAVVVPKRNGGNLFMHPAAMLTAFVATALMELEGPGSREPGVGEESRGAGGKHDGGATRVAATAPSGVTPVNAPGRAVSFNDAGINADAAQSGAVLTAVLAAMGMSGAVEQGAEEALADADALKVARAGFAPLDSMPGRDAMDGAPARTAPRPQGSDGTAEDAGSGVDQPQGADAALAVAIADLLDRSQAEPIELLRGTLDRHGVDLPLVAFEALSRDIASESVSRALEARASVPDAAAAEAAPDAGAGEQTPGDGEPHDLPSFDLNLVSFGEVALDLDGLRALFPSVSEEDVVDDAPTEGEVGAAPDEPAGDDAQPPPDGAAEAPAEQPAVEDGGRTQPPEDKTDAAEDGADDAPPTTADLVFSGSESQNATLRGVVDFVIDGQAIAPTVTVSRDSFLGETASQYAAHNDALPDVVIFDSDVIELPAFVFMPGVVFVHMENVKTGPIFFENEPHSFDLDNGGSVMLIGVADVATEAA